MSNPRANLRLAFLLQLSALSLLQATPCETILKEVASAVSAMRADRQAREAAATAAAERFIDGGRLWGGGSIPRFDIEWLGRAGGLMPVAAVKKPEVVGSQDVLVYGCLPGAEAADAATLKGIHERGALVVAVGGAAQAAALIGVVDHFLANGLPADTPLPTQVAAAMDFAQLWAFTGELVAACTRAGKMPTLWQSVMVPGARERNARYRSLRFHEDLTVPATAPDVLGEQYLSAIARAVAGLTTRKRQMEAAGAAIRRTVEAGGTVFHANMGHFEPARLLPEDFGVPLTVLPRKEAEAALRAEGEKGDCVFLVWYTEMPTELLAAAREVGATSVCMVAANPAAPLDTSLADIFLDPQWVFGDAVVEIPGYPVKVLPPSGVLNSLVFYAVLAEARGK